VFTSSPIASSRTRTDADGLTAIHPPTIIDLSEKLGVFVRGQPTVAWGKLRRNADNSVVEWHPLVDHCCDVAMVCRALLTDTILSQRMARLANVESLSTMTIERLCVLAALHDLGKFNHGFQAKADTALRSRWRGHVDEAIGLMNGPLVDDLIDRGGLRPLLDWGSTDGVSGLLYASIGHHGRPGDPDAPFRRELWAKANGRDPIEEIGRLMRRCQSWFPLAFADGEPLPESLAFHHGFSGLVMLADWLGSDVERGFTYSERVDGDRMAAAGAATARLFRSMGLNPLAARQCLQSKKIDLDLILPGAQARGVQRSIVSVGATGPGSLVIIEADTGSGKTEAALCHFLAQYKAGDVDGMYFALPTRTAATQIFGRVARAITLCWPDESAPPVTLAVPGYLRVDRMEGERLAPFQVLWSDDPEDESRFRGWAAEHPKRYLAGSVVVGTIDQVLMSALQVSHAHLRATGLSRLLLVVDEVHASDAYMGRLLEAVLSEHRRSGGSVVLLSATLGASLRARLEDNYARLPTLEESIGRAYPIVSVTEGAQTTLLRPSERAKQKSTELVLQPWMGQPATVAEYVAEALSAGAKVAVIHNTVRDCVATQLAVEALIGDQHSALLSVEVLGRRTAVAHHSRFSPDDRRILDAAVIKRFGRKRAPGPALVVGTQTIQQSLDLDADLLLTDLCPADVLLQRIGRLHRHKRDDRPREFRQARCVVFVPADRDLAPILSQRAGPRPGGLGTVYENLLMLEATWRQIEARTRWLVPRDCRALVEATTHPEALARIGDELGPQWREHQQSVLGIAAAERSHATIQMMRRDAGFLDHDVLFPSRAVAGRISTRLGLDDLLVRFGADATQAVASWCEPLTQLTIPGWMLPGAPADVGAPNMLRAGDLVEFDVCGRCFRYDRLGVRPHEGARREA